MKKYNFVILTVLCLFTKALLAEFTVSAETERTVFMYLDYKTIKSYYSNLGVYEKYFPNLDSVKAKDSLESIWSYRLDYPLSPVLMVNFDMVRQTDNDSTLVFEAKPGGRDYLYWRAIFSPYSLTQTNVKIYIKASITRDKGSDIHMLAGLFGEEVVCSKMKKELSNELTTFLDSSSHDLYNRARNISNSK